MSKSRLRRFSFVILLALLFSLFGSAVQAMEQELEATVDVFRVDKTFVILKITFTTEINGNFAGTLAGKHFDCITVPSNVLVCIGRFRTDADPSFLTIYDQDTEENILHKLLTPPPSTGQGEGGETPSEGTPPPPPSGDDDEFNPA